MAACFWRGTTPAICVTFNGILTQILPTISNISCPISTQPLLHLVQHVADWVASFPISQYSHPPSLQIPSYSPFTSHFLPYQLPPPFSFTSPLSFLPYVHENQGQSSSSTLKRFLPEICVKLLICPYFSVIPSHGDKIQIFKSCRKRFQNAFSIQNFTVNNFCSP